MNVKLETVGMDKATECFGAAIKFGNGDYILSCLVKREVKGDPLQKWESKYDDCFEVRIEDGIYHTYRENGQRVRGPLYEAEYGTNKDLDEEVRIVDFVKCNTREDWLSFKLKHGEENYRVSAI